MNKQFNRFISFDYGTKRIGMATGSLLSGQAEPLFSASNQQNNADWTTIDKALTQWRPDALIVGLPINLDGEETKSSKAARSFAQVLHEKTALPVIMVDERLTSSEADYLIRQQSQNSSRNPTSIRKKQVKSRDCVAAQLILQTYLNSPGHFSPI